jgi:hypothetical protein
MLCRRFHCGHVLVLSILSLIEEELNISQDIDFESICQLLPFFIFKLKVVLKSMTKKLTRDRHKVRVVKKRGNVKRTKVVSS